MAKTLFFVFLSLLSPISFSKSNPNPNTTSSSPSAAHTDLTKYGFPIGLLPTDVLTYTLNHSSGDFSVHLGDICQVTLPPDNYLVTYSKKITGKIIEGRMASLDGIRVWGFFKWWYITGIKSNGEDLVFEVGVVTAKYPSKNFLEIPPCEGKRSAS